MRLWCTEMPGLGSCRATWRERGRLGLKMGVEVSLTQLFRSNDTARKMMPYFWRDFLLFFFFFFFFSLFFFSFFGFFFFFLFSGLSLFDGEEQCEDGHGGDQQVPARECRQAAASAGLPLFLEKKKTRMMEY